MKRVKLTKRQLSEVLNVAVDVKNGDVKGSIQSAKTETDRTVGASAERNYVISGDELNENSEDENTQPVSFQMLQQLIKKASKKGGNPDELTESIIRYINEGNTKIYTKKQLEEARLKKLKENSVKTTKKALLEKFALNELDSKTYMSASDKMMRAHDKKNNAMRSFQLSDYSDEQFKKEVGITNPEEFFEINKWGFDFDILGLGFAYNKNTDEIYETGTDNILEPNDTFFKNTKPDVKKLIFAYFEKFNPDSKYNDPSIW